MRPSTLGSQFGLTYRTYENSKGLFLTAEKSGDVAVTDEDGDRHESSNGVIASMTVARGGQEGAPNRIYQGEDMERRGQQRWYGHGFERSIPDYVSWLGAAGGTPREHAEAVRVMAGHAVRVLGTVPAADRSLSDDGARIARGMGRVFGVPAHPENREREASIGRFPPQNVLHINETSGMVTASEDPLTDDEVHQARLMSWRPPHRRGPKVEQPTLF